MLRGRAVGTVRAWPWGLMAEILDSRADLTDVAEKRPDLAGRVLAAQVELGRGEPHPTPGEADPEAWVRAPVGDADRGRQADADLQQAPVVVRQQPGFASFLLPRRSPTCLPARTPERGTSTV